MATSLPALADAIVSCERCPRLRAHCREIARVRRRAFAEEEYWARPVPGLGDPNARLLVVGLAPAAHGANRTGQLFTGDSSGSWLYEALHRYGWSNQPNSLSRGDGLRLTDCWITAAAHCAPPGNKPTSEELELCRPYLEAEIRLLRSVRVVLGLGRIGWERWLRAAGWWDRLPARERPAFAHGAEAVLPDGTVLVAAFHPSRQNTNTGKLTRGMWYAVFEGIRVHLPEAKGA
jgi:uracil-DNA glycosylase family 4